MKKIFFIYLFITYTFATKVPICTSVVFSAKWFECGEALIYAYDIQMKVTENLNNQTFPNIVTFTKLSEYTANYGYYFAYTPIYYGYFRYWNDVFALMKWNDTDTPFTLHLPNGDGVFDFNFFDGYWSVIYDDEYSNTFINNGEIFINYFPLASPCLSYNDPGNTCSFWNVYSNQSICCNNFVYVDIPDYENEICESFQSATILKDSTQAFIATLNATFFIENEWINLNVTDYKLYNNSIEMRYGIGGDMECTGNNGSPKSFCSFSLPEDGSDIRYNFLIDYEWIDQNQTYNGYYSTAGILMTIFTSKNPCWKKSAELAYGNGTSFDTSFCCTLFKSVSQPTLSPSTITPIFTDSCLYYTSITNISDNLTSLKIEYTLNLTGIEVNIENYNSPKNSSVQLEIYSSDTFLQPCKATTNNPKNQCFYKLSDNKKYELKMRTSIFPDGFNIFSFSGAHGKLTSPVLNKNSPCYYETNPYNNANSNITASTSFCCNSYG